MAAALDANVNALAALARIEVGELDPKAARSAISKIVASGLNAENAAEIYASMRTWVGRLLRGAASGEDLRAWHHVLRATGAQFRNELGEWGIRLSVLSEMVFERVALSESRDKDEVLSRRHAQAILNELSGEPGWRLSRAKLRERLQLQQANFSRVCMLLVDAGLITRFTEGKAATFALTAEGIARARPKEKQEATGLISNTVADLWEQAFDSEPADAPNLDAWVDANEVFDELPLAA